MTDDYRGLFHEFSAIARQFREHRVAYAVVGGIAMAIHDQPRYTKDIDVLVKSEQMPRVVSALESIDYLECAHPWTFKNTKLTLHRFIKVEGVGHVLLDVLAADDDDEHRAMIGRALRRKWMGGTIRIVRKDDLVAMKSRRSSEQDRVDIRKLRHDKDGESPARGE